MNALDNILNRVSARSLTEPHPTQDEMNEVFKGALRAPDHAWLRPSSFIQVTGDGIDKLSKIFEEYAKTVPDITDEIITKYKNAPYRAPMIIILVNSIKNHPKVPDIEQKLSTAAFVFNTIIKSQQSPPICNPHDMPIDPIAEGADQEPSSSLATTSPVPPLPATINPPLAMVINANPFAFDNVASVMD